MGKGTDKLYITQSEWSGADGSHSASRGIVARKNDFSFRRLPFDRCALSLLPYEHPVCTADGTVFDLTNIVPWLKKHGTNPVNGEKMESKDLLKMTMTKNEDGEYCDPVTFKVFTDNTHIVVIKTSGNVYAWDTIERLNIKPKNWTDLVSGETFTRKDIITMQDPQNVGSRNMSSFKYLQDGETTLTEEQEIERANPLNNINLAASGSMAKVLAAKDAVAKARAAKAAAAQQGSSGSLKKSSGSGGNVLQTKSFVEKSATPYNAARHTTGKAAASFTSTSIAVHTGSERALLTDEEYMLKPKRIKIKGYARISTTLGNLNIEMHTDLAPKAVYNFVKLAQKGYYNGTKFHRNIRSFMIQGGDPTGTGRGGASYWGKNFDDELDGPLTHDSRGVISMANKGKNTNSSQFFICYKAAPHLNRKHTIWGKVVGGIDVLDRMETTPTDESDRPKTDIEILDVTVFIDPFEEFQKQRAQKEEEEKQEEEVKKAGGTDDDKTTWTGKRLRTEVSGGNKTSSSSLGVGKYLKAAAQSGNNAEDEIIEELPEESYYQQPVKKKAKGGGFGNFDNW